MQSTKSSNVELFGERTSPIYRNVKLMGRANFFSFFFQKPLYEVCLVRTKEQVGEKRNTVVIHRNADFLLKNTPTKHSKYVVNPKLKHFDDISFKYLFSRIRVVFLQNNICPFLRQYTCIYVDHSFLWNTVGFFWFWVGNSCVECRKVKFFNARGEGPWLYVLRSIEIFRIHIWITPPLN
jgi:hypothetical protein